MSNSLHGKTIRLVETDYLRGDMSEQVSCDVPEAREVAYPLFEYSVVIAAITERLRYRSRLCRHPKHWVFLILQGEMNFDLEGQTFRARPGQLVVAPVWSMLQYSSDRPVRWLYLQMEDTEFWRPLRGIGPYVRDYEAAPLLFLQVRSILDAYGRTDPKRILLAHHCSRSAIQLLEHEMEIMAGGVNERREKLRDLMGEIARQPGRAWPVTEMARRVAVSPGHLRALFRRELRISPRAAVIRCRMKAAMTLLASSDRVLEDIASVVGYDSLASFSRLFKKHVGIPPGAFRKTHQESAPLEPPGEFDAR